MVLITDLNRRWRQQKGLAQRRVHRVGIEYAVVTGLADICKHVAIGYCVIRNRDGTLLQHVKLVDAHHSDFTNVAYLFQWLCADLRQSSPVVERHPPERVIL